MSISKIPKTKEELKVKILANSTLDTATGCCLWQGGRTGRKEGQKYGTLLFRMDGLVQTRKVHRLMAYAQGLLEDLKSPLCVCHSCDNPLCVSIEHLFLGTVLENNLDKELKGRSVSAKGEQTGNAKLKQWQVEQIKKEYRPGETKALCAKYNISRSTLQNLRHGETWQPKTKITFELVREIRKLIKEGKNNCQIARLLNVNRKSVSYIKLGQQWVHTQ